MTDNAFIEIFTALTDLVPSELSSSRHVFVIISLGMKSLRKKNKAYNQTTSRYGDV